MLHSPCTIQGMWNLLIICCLCFWQENTAAVFQHLSDEAVNSTGGTGVEHGVYRMCDIHTLSPGGVGTHGVVLPPNYHTTENCHLLIEACPECQLKINVTEMILSPCNEETVPSNCNSRCPNIMLYEPEYPEEASYIFNGQKDNEVEILTMSSRLNIILLVCTADVNDGGALQYRINFSVTEKLRVYNGSADDTDATGYITSPFFPHHYATRNEVYTYLIQNTDPNGLIRLGFSDWSLSQNSRITIYLHNSEETSNYVRRDGDGSRPFLLSSGPHLFIKFETGGAELLGIPYLGFKAKYEFVSSPSWPEKPYSGRDGRNATVCGEYYHSLYGGNFQFDTAQCWPGEKVDCLWVVFKHCSSKSQNLKICGEYDGHLSLRIDEFSVDSDDDSLEIRAGNYSGANLLGRYNDSNLTGTDFVGDHAFYLRLRVTCTRVRYFQAVFSTFTIPKADGCTEYERQFECNNHRCIADTLKCDGIDHCGDASDEKSCMSTTISAQCSEYRMCQNGKGWFCPQQLCDDISDCADGTDEQHCWDPIDIYSTTMPPGFSGYHWATFVPVGLVFFLMAIIVCIIISCCARRKRNALRRRQRAVSGMLPGLNRGSGSETRLNINVEIQHYPDAPPSYSEAMRYDPRYGICNLGFSASESSDPLMLPPPPYTPSPADPYPILHGVGVTHTDQSQRSQLASTQSLSSEPPEYSVLPEVHRPHSRGDDSSRRRRRRVHRPRRRQRNREHQAEGAQEAREPVSPTMDSSSHNVNSTESCNTRNDSIEEIISHPANTHTPQPESSPDEIISDNALQSRPTSAVSNDTRSKHRKNQDSLSGASLDGGSKDEDISEDNVSRSDKDRNESHSRNNSETTVAVVDTHTIDNDNISTPSSNSNHSSIIEDGSEVPSGGNNMDMVPPSIGEGGPPAPTGVSDDVRCSGINQEASFV